MFTVRIHRWPLGEVLGEIDQALAAELRALPVDVATYKNLDHWRHELAAHLDGEGEAVDRPASRTLLTAHERTARPRRCDVQARHRRRVRAARRRPTRRRFGVIAWWCAAARCPRRSTPVGPRPVARPTWRDKRTAGRLRARKVRRLVRHVEPWSVLKVALIFYFCLWVILLIAGVMLWSLAVSSGTVDNVETFVTELFALESFTFNADQIFRASAIGGLVLVVAGRASPS